MPNRIGNQNPNNIFLRNNLLQSTQLKSTSKLDRTNQLSKMGAPIEHTFVAHEGNKGAGNFTPTLDNLIYSDLGNLVEQLRDKVTTSTYSKTSSSASPMKGSYDRSSQTTDWKKRIDWKGSTDRSAEGLGTTKGPKFESKTTEKTLLSGSVSRSAVKGADARIGDEVQGRYGKASVSGRVYSEAKAKASAGYTVTNHSAEMNAGAEVGVVAMGVEARGKVSSPSATIGGQEVNLQAEVYGKATVEANGKVSASVVIDKDPPKAVVSGKAGAFAGAKATGHARFGIGDIFRVTVSGEAWAGAGAEASAQAGYENGKVSFGASAGAGLGLGGKVGVKVEFDAAKAAQMAKEVADVDGDGKLTLHDGAVALNKAKKAGQEFVDKTLDKALDKLDADNDGRFSMKDMSLHASRLKSKLHRSLDADGDGKIELSDLKRKGAETLDKVEHQVKDTVSRTYNKAKSIASEVANFFGW